MVGPRTRRLMLVTHVATSVGLLGAISAFLVLAITGIATSDAVVTMAVYPSMEIITWIVIIPLLLAALAIGIIQSLATQWGLIRHWWVVAKLMVTTFAGGVLLLQLEGISRLADAPDLENPELFHVRLSTVVHASAGLIVLLIPLALSIYKPRRLTPYGKRKQEQRRLEAGPGPVPSSRDSLLP
ncbi:Putative integral membrane protein [Neorhizobium galegae bv. officinalis]|nr:Putative integral membrane protein [Neorhizobium galegae bv. officinalis]